MVYNRLDLSLLEVACFPIIITIFFVFSISKLGSLNMQGHNGSASKEGNANKSNETSKSQASPGMATSSQPYSPSRPSSLSHLERFAATNDAKWTNPPISSAVPSRQQYYQKPAGETDASAAELSRLE